MRNYTTALRSAILKAEIREVINNSKYVDNLEVLQSLEELKKEAIINVFSKN